MEPNELPWLTSAYVFFYKAGAVLFAVAVIGAAWLFHPVVAVIAAVVLYLPVVAVLFDQPQ